MKIVLLGSCINVPYEVFAPRSKSIPDTDQLRAYLEWKAGNQEEAYQLAEKLFYPKIREADIIIAITKEDGTIGIHTQRDIDFAKSLGKQVIQITVSPKVAQEKTK